MPLNDPQQYDQLSTPELQGILEEKVNTFMGQFAGQSDAEPPAEGGEATGLPPEIEEPAAGDTAEDALGGILASGVTDPVDILSALQERGFEISKSPSLPGEGAEATPEEALAAGEPPPEEAEAEEEEEDSGLPPMIRARRKAAKNAADKADQGGEAA